eukprot:g3626.t1
MPTVSGLSSRALAQFISSLSTASTELFHAADLSSQDLKSAGTRLLTISEELSGNNTVTPQGSGILVYSTTGCKPCSKVKGILRSLQYDFNSVDLLEMGANGRQKLFEATGKNSVPQILFFNTHVGGLAELEQMKAAGTIDETLANARQAFIASGKKIPLSSSAVSAQVKVKVPVPEKEQTIILKEGKKKEKKSYSYDHTLEVAVAALRSKLEIGRKFRGIATWYNNVFEGQQFLDAFIEVCRNQNVKLPSYLAEVVHFKRLQKAVLNNNETFDSNLGVGVESASVAVQARGSEAAIAFGQALLDIGIIHPIALSTKAKSEWEECRSFQIVRKLVSKGLPSDMAYEERVTHTRDLYRHFAADSSLYRFQEDEKTTVYNTSRILHLNNTPLYPKVDAGSIAERLRISILKMYDSFLSEDGNAVDYAALSVSKEFREFKYGTAPLLQLVDLDELVKNRNLCIAFFLNVYNALVVHGLIETSPKQNKAGETNDSTPSTPKKKQSVLSRLQFFRKTAYNIGGHSFSCDDIEHGVLRGNRKSPAALSPQFSSSDPRFFLSQSMIDMDPRIHFALVCGAKGCPSIKLYSAADVDAELDVAAKSFLSDESDNIEISSDLKTVTLSKILDWYGGDFGKNNIEKLKWILPFTSPLTQVKLKKIIDQNVPMKVIYSPYDWTLNA